MSETSAPQPLSEKAVRLREELKSLIKKEAFKKFDQPVRLSSGSLSTDYIDGKQISLFPDRAVVFARWVLESLDLRKFDAIGGMSLGADPLVSCLCLVAYLERGIRIPGFLVRKEPKPHGLEKNIEGVELKPGMKVLIVEDVTTQGQATLMAIRAVEKTGARVAQVLCLVDREEGGSAVLSKLYPFTAVFKKSEF